MGVNFVRNRDVKQYNSTTDIPMGTFFIVTGDDKEGIFYKTEYVFDESSHSKDTCIVSLSTGWMLNMYEFDKTYSYSSFEAITIENIQYRETKEVNSTAEPLLLNRGDYMIIANNNFNLYCLGKRINDNTDKFHAVLIDPTAVGGDSCYGVWIVPSITFIYK